jgi:hypothetical protein
VVQRLREFRPSGAQAEWLAGCEGLSVTPRPWQCLPPQRDYRWQELR